MVVKSTEKLAEGHVSSGSVKGQRGGKTGIGRVTHDSPGLIWGKNSAEGPLDLEPLVFLQASIDTGHTEGSMGGR